MDCVPGEIVFPILTSSRKLPKSILIDVFNERSLWLEIEARIAGILRFDLFVGAAHIEDLLGCGGN